MNLSYLETDIDIIMNIHNELENAEDYSNHYLITCVIFYVFLSIGSFHYLSDVLTLLSILPIMILCILPFFVFYFFYNIISKRIYLNTSKSLSIFQINKLINMQDELSSNGKYIIQNNRFAGCNDKERYLFSILCSEIKFLRVSKFIEYQKEYFDFIENKFSYTNKISLFKKLKDKLNNFQVGNDTVVTNLINEINEKIKQ